MKFLKAGVVVCIFISVAGVSFSTKSKSKSSTPPVISIDSVAKYVNKTVTLESQVVEIEHPKNKSLIELDKDFKVVVDAKSKIALAKVGIDIDSLPGKTVKITGKLYKDARYGIQMDLTGASQIMITKEAPSKTVSTTTAVVSTTSSSTVQKKIVPFSGVIQVSDVPTHIDQSGTVEGKVVKTTKSSRSNTYFLNFSEKQNVFTVVIFSRIVDQFAKDSVDILSFEGKKVRVTGSIQSPAQYGPEILLDKPADIKIIE